MAREAVVMLERERSLRLANSGTSNSPAVRAGRRLTVSGNAFAGAYVVTTVRHAAWAAGGCFAYGKSFSAIPDSATYRPPLRTPVPRIDGVAPDLIGFGRSDKPADMDLHTYVFHVHAMSRFVRTLDLRGVTFFGQDWGGLIGLRVVAENPKRFAAVVVSNTALPTGAGKPSPAFEEWKRQNAAMIERGDMPVGKLIAEFTGDPSLAPPYDAPFPDPRYKAGPLVLPQRVPVSTDDPVREANLAAWAVFRKWEKPFVTAFGDSDPITAGLEQAFQEQIPGATGQPHQKLKGAGHFIQETHSDELAQIIIRVVKALPTGAQDRASVIRQRRTAARIPCIPPAIRAMRVDPVKGLRAE